ncbi:MAG: AzlD domain-containing protein [Phototrophicaceae bacterium]
MTLFLLFLLIGFLTFLERISFLVIFRNMEMSPLMLKALRYVPVTVLFAIATPNVLRTDGMIDFSLNPKTIASICAMLIAWRTRNILYTIIFGMGTFWLSRYLFSLLTL